MYAEVNEPVLQTSSLDQLRAKYLAVRSHSTVLASSLSAEDQCIQSMADASPTKWHLAHTTWFFETLVLGTALPHYQAFNPQFSHLFNSYYEALGPRHHRAQRGLITRPGIDEVHAYRKHVDAAVMRLLGQANSPMTPQLESVLTLGLHHEQQHQELLLTDILHAFSCNPMLPAVYSQASFPDALLTSRRSKVEDNTNAQKWITFPGGQVGIGHSRSVQDGFYFDNETPRHTVLLQPYQLAHGLVTCAEFAAFIADGGYSRPALWLSDGWALCKLQAWTAPAYWHSRANLPPTCKSADNSAEWYVLGLSGLQPMDGSTPVAQLSFYEAAAYAEWAGARLPTEFEWEAAHVAGGLEQMTGHVWQWTRSSYDPYPGFRPLPGLAAEYNGKFMVGQLVLRGGSAATPAQHTRPTYRNFFPPAARWQFSGLRLAKDAL